MKTLIFLNIAEIPIYLLSILSLDVDVNCRKWVDNKKMEEQAVMRHYILTHPELFPEPKKVKYIDHIQAWRPVRW